MNASDASGKLASALHSVVCSSSEPHFLPFRSSVPVLILFTGVGAVVLFVLRFHPRRANVISLLIAGTVSSTLILRFTVFGSCQDPNDAATGFIRLSIALFITFLICESVFVASRKL